MKIFILRRLLLLVPMLLGTSAIIFFIFALTPGDFIDGNPNLTADRARELKALYGFDRPVLERYLVWLGNILSGDPGFSLQHQIPVTTLLNQHVWNSFLLAGTALVLYWGLSLFVGVTTAVRPYSWYDRIVTLAVFVAMSFPVFFLCLLMIKWFAVDLRWLPASGMTSTGSESAGWDRIVEIAAHMVLPVLVLTMLQAGSLTRYVRAGMMECLAMDFVRTARAKGLKERTVVFKHALRNALLPLITLLGIELPGLFSGAIVTEKIFNWPGMGRVYLDTLSARDYTVLMGFTMFLAVVTILGNLLADIAYAAADPRIRLRRE